MRTQCRRRFLHKALQHRIIQLHNIKRGQPLLNTQDNSVTDIMFDLQQNLQLLKIRAASRFSLHQTLVARRFIHENKLCSTYPEHGHKSGKPLLNTQNTNRVHEQTCLAHDQPL
jgi:hypothetical protein